MGAVGAAVNDLRDARNLLLPISLARRLRLAHHER
jgi:hypothetical protein